MFRQNKKIEFKFLSFPSQIDILLSFVPFYFVLACICYIIFFPDFSLFYVHLFHLFTAFLPRLNVK
jgi:hypothetical protein